MERGKKAADGRNVGTVADPGSGETADGSTGHAAPSKNQKEGTAPAPKTDVRATEQVVSKGTSILIMASFGLLILFVAIWFLVISWMK
jgi:hypothetical protein